MVTFLKSVGIWATFTCLPPLILYCRSPLLRRTDLFFFVPFFLIAAVGCIALELPFLRPRTPRAALLIGAAIGLVVPIVGGSIWMRIFPGFESQPAIFLGTLMITVPSAVGGGVAGRLRFRWKRQLANA